MATIGAGAQLLPVYEQLAAHGVSVPLGSCGTVGVSGLALGGGIGMSARLHGLTCDSVLELDLGSDVIAAPLPESLVAQALSVVARGVGSLKFSPLTGAISRAAPDATAFPWRRAFALLQWLVVDADPEPSYAWIGAGHEAVAAASVGRYVNYLEPDTDQLPRYYGPNHERLRRVRAAADPDRVLRTPFAV